MITQHRERFIHAAIAAPQPDYFWRHSESQTDFLKIGAFGDNGQRVFASESPHGFIVCLIEPDARNVYGFGEFCGETRNQFRRKVFVEQELHAASTSCWRSRSAA